MYGPVEQSILNQVARLRQSPEAVSRDARMSRIRMVRAGNLELIAPDAFSMDWPKPIIANFIETAARDIAESLGPLPTLNCATGKMNSDTAKKRASLKTKIGANYWIQSRLKQHSVQAADRFFSYGFLPILVEPDLDANLPRIRFEDPMGSYPETDRYGRVRTFVKVYLQKASVLGAMFPEMYSQLCLNDYGQPQDDVDLEVVRFFDADCQVMFVPSKKNCLLSKVSNPISRCPVALATRPGIDDEHRGQYDDAIWVQIARAKMASLALEAGMKAVEAPIAVPQDMVEMPIGPDSIWRTDSPDKIRRVSMEIPNSAFQMDQRLEMEQMRSTRYPEARSGNISASVITGKGVEALMGSFDSQIKASQDQYGEALAEATSIAFEMDEKVFGDVTKTIYGVSAGRPFKETYSAAKAITEDYTCDVTYGMMAGLAPNNAAVMILQLLGAGLISKEAAQKQMPFDVDPMEMAASIAIELGRDAILQGVAALAQSIPAAAQAGQDPLMIVTQLATFLAKMKSGSDVEAAALEAFKPPPAPPGQEAPQGDAAMAQAAAGGGGGLPPGLGSDGMMEGVAPGQAGMAPGGMPDIASMAANFRNGQAQLSAGVSRKRAI